MTNNTIVSDVKGRLASVFPGHGVFVVLAAYLLPFTQHIVNVINLGAK